MLDVVRECNPTVKKFLALQDKMGSRGIVNDEIRLFDRCNHYFAAAESTL